MFKLACHIPRSVAIAVSGGPDSQALLSFCQFGRKNIRAIHIDHGTAHSKEARQFVEAYCKQHSVPLSVYEVPAEIKHSELAWRDYRLGIYKQHTNTGMYLATGATLDDLIEWYMMTSLHGQSKFMKPVDEEHKLIKPFLFTEKAELVSWCQRKSIPFITDPTNEGNHNARAILRGVMPQLAKIHPGFKTSIKNKAIKESSNGL